jgi:AraC-like DNA-binding protein
MTISVDLGFAIDSSKPILPLALDVFETQCAEKHKHPRAQLIYSCTGSMKVVAADSVWLVSSNQAIWVPGMIEHQVHFLKRNHIRNLFIDPSVAGQLPDKCFALDVSPFLQALIQKVTNIGNDYEMNSAQGRLISVLMDELAVITPTKTFLPTSNDFHVKKVMDALINDPGDKRSIEDFAELACTSSRTLARLFIKEVGLTFGDWRKRVRLMVAIEKLEKGFSVSQISVDLGYGNPSAFVEMFGKEFGISPRKYLERNRSS